MSSADPFSEIITSAASGKEFEKLVTAMSRIHDVDDGRDQGTGNGHKIRAGLHFKLQPSPMFCFE
jgi:hypothetical protein